MPIRGYKKPETVFAEVDIQSCKETKISNKIDGSEDDTSYAYVGCFRAEFSKNSSCDDE